VEYHTVDRTGLSRLYLGDGVFSPPRGNVNDHESVAVIHTAFGAGSNFIDTADVQSESQVVAGKALCDRRRVVLTGKLNSALWAG
jgi:aryl-alcohol dehydrogenase-like predicted oxidoreductase